MKLKNLFLAVFAAGVALVGCDPETLLTEVWEADGIPSEITITKAGGSQTIRLTSSIDWKIRGVENAADWLDVQVDGESITSPNTTISGGSAAREVVLSALANTGTDRSVDLTLFADLKHKVSVKVTQEGDLGDGIANVTVAQLLENPVEGNVYRLSGTVSRFSASYCSFDLTDDTGTIYVYSVDADSKAKYTDVIKNGGKITIHGEYKWFADKSQHEIVNAVIEEYDGGNAANPDDATDATVADFIKAADGSKYYRLTGTVSGFSDKYFSFDLTDATGTIYVYSVTDASKTEWKDKVKNGYKVVIRGQYEYYAAKSQHEVVNAIIDSVEEAQAEKVTATGLVIAVSKVGFLISTESGIVYVYDSSIAVSVKVGDNVTVNGDKTTYNGVDEVEKYTVTVNSSGNAVPAAEPTVLDAAAFDKYETLFGLVQFSGKLVKSGNYYNVKVKDATRTGSLSNPVSVSEDLLNKWVDVTGYFVGISGSSYFNVIVSELALSEDQHEDENQEPEGATVGENEVGYELTTAEIVAAFASSDQTKDTYGDYTITSSTGNWTGNMNTKKGLAFIQLRNKSGAHLKSPEFSSNIKRIVLRMNEKTVVRTMYAVPADTQIPTSSDNYTSSLWSNSLGTVSTKGGEETVVMSVTGTNKSFTLIAGNGAVYIDSILVICEK